MSKSPVIIFDEESRRNVSPDLIFTKEENQVVPEFTLRIGSFHFEDVNFCSFVKKNGQMCGKKTTFSSLLFREVPACIRHLEKYCETSILSDTFLSPRATFTELYTEEIEDKFYCKKIKKPVEFLLEKIPKAIDRSKECVVCFEEKNPLVLPCGHTVCFSCIQLLKKSFCPMCRKAFKKDDLRRL